MRVKDVEKLICSGCSSLAENWIGITQQTAYSVSYRAVHVLYQYTIKAGYLAV